MDILMVFMALAAIFLSAAYAIVGPPDDTDIKQCSKCKFIGKFSFFFDKEKNKVRLTCGRCGFEYWLD